MKIVVAAAAPPAREAESLRAALGLTLRGAFVVAVTRDTTSRASQTLALFNHRLTETLELDADAVEIWTPAADFPVVRDGRRILHLVRPGAAARGVADGDRVVYLAETSPDDVVALAFEYELVVTW